MADIARDLEPRAPDWAVVVERELTDDEARSLIWHGRLTDVYLRVLAPGGAHVGTLHFFRPTLGDVVSARLSRGHAPMYERMLELRDPGRREAAILFADLEASSELSRRLSSRAYFALIRSLTDLVDAAVIANGGLIGKHAGDGASALFVVDGVDAESAAARGAIDAARRIRYGAAGLLDDATDVLVNVGLHSRPSRHRAQTPRRFVMQDRSPSPRSEGTSGRAPSARCGSRTGWSNMPALMAKRDAARCNRSGRRQVGQHLRKVREGL